MTTATHPLQIAGTPRRQYLAGEVWLPALTSLTVAATGFVVLAWLVTGFETGQLFMPESTMSSIIVAAIVVCAGSLLSAASCRRRSWWAINPTVADHGHAPRWVAAVRTATSLAALAAPAAVVAAWPGMLTYFMGISLTTLWMGMFVLPYVFNFAVRFTAKHSARVTATAESRPVRPWEAAGEIIVLCVMWAVPAAAGNPLWGYFPAGEIPLVVMLNLIVVVPLILLRDFRKDIFGLGRTAHSGTAPV